MAIHCGLSKSLPLALSANMSPLATPNSASASICLSRFCSRVDTRAYPYVLAIKTPPSRPRATRPNLRGRKQAGAHAPTLKGGRKPPGIPGFPTRW